MSADDDERQLVEYEVRFSTREVRFRVPKAQVGDRGILADMVRSGAVLSCEVYGTTRSPWRKSWLNLARVEQIL